MNDEEFEQLKEAARKLGHAHGHNAGTWVFDGNTPTETYTRWLQWIEDGDPEMGNHYRSPLSGEYADDMNPQKLMLALDAPSLSDVEESDICGAYESAHYDAWAEECERVVRYQTQKD